MWGGMKKIILIMLGIFAVPTMLMAEEGESAWSLDTNFSFYSSYMYRGITLYDGPSAQPSVNLNYDTGDMGVLHLNLWSHIPAESHNSSGKFTEFDATITYDYSFEDVTLSVGHLWITYSDDIDVQSPESSEIFLSAAFDNMPLAPVFTVYHDYRAYDSQYYELLLSHTFEWEKFNLTPFVDIGFASNGEKYFYKNGFVQNSIGVSTDIEAGPLTLTPLISYTVPHDDVDDNRVWGGISINFTFE